MEWKYKPAELELFHVHTKRCKHAEDIADEEYVKKAIELGANRIVFTDHAPFPDNPFGNRMDYEELPEYIASMKALKKQYSEKIEVLYGLEVEYISSFDEYIKQLKESKNFDLLILGQHICEIPQNSMHWSFECEDKSKEHIYLVEAMLNGIDTGYFDVVAHPDRVFRRVKEWTDTEDDLAREIRIHATKKRMPIEWNYSSYKRKGQYKKEFWDLVDDTSLVVEGIDAHSIIDIEKWACWNESR